MTHKAVGKTMKAAKRKAARRYIAADFGLLEIVGVGPMVVRPPMKPWLRERTKI